MAKQKLMAEIVYGDNGEIHVDTDTIHHGAAPAIGYDDDDYDDDGDFEGEDGDFEGEDGDFEGEDDEGYYDEDDEDSEFGRRNKRRGGGKGKNRRKGRGGKRGGGKRRSKKLVDTSLSGKETISAAGTVKITIRPQHFFKLDDLSFVGTAEGTDLMSIYFGTKRVFSSQAGMDTTLFSAQSQMRGKFKGHIIPGGYDIVLTFETTSTSGVVKVALFGQARAGEV